MGLIQAALTTAGSVLADQWKELYCADSLASDVLMVKGHIQNKRGGNYGSENIITNGSGLLVADGQCAIIVDQGEITEVCSEPGYYTYDQSTEPTIFCGNLKEGIKQSWEVMKKRFTYAGATGHDQRVYFFNTKEMVNNLFGTPNPIPFKVVDKNIGLDLDAALRISGSYSFKMVDPILFYKSVAGNIKSEFRVSDFGTQLKAEFMQGLQLAIGELSKLNIRPSDIPLHVEELAQSVNAFLSDKWGKGRGIEVVSIAMNPIILPEDQAKLIQDLQKAASLRDPDLRQANLAAAAADSMRTAAGNEGGAAMGFMGMGMAMNAAGTMGSLFGGQAAQTAQAPVGETPTYVAPAGANYCPNCGTKLNGAKFCPTCGLKIGE